MTAMPRREWAALLPAAQAALEAGTQDAFDALRQEACRQGAWAVALGCTRRLGDGTPSLDPVSERSAQDLWQHLCAAWRFDLELRCEAAGTAGWWTESPRDAARLLAALAVDGAAAAVAAQPGAVFGRVRRRLAALAADGDDERAAEVAWRLVVALWGVRAWPWWGQALARCTGQVDGPGAATLAATVARDAGEARAALCALARGGLLERAGAISVLGDRGGHEVVALADPLWRWMAAGEIDRRCAPLPPRACHPRAEAEVARALRQGESVVVAGPPGSGRRTVVTRAARRAGVEVVDVPPGADAHAWVGACAATGTICLLVEPTGTDDEIAAWWEAVCTAYGAIASPVRLAVVAGPEPRGAGVLRGVRHVTLGTPARRAQYRVWRETLCCKGWSLRAARRLARAAVAAAPWLPGEIAAAAPVAGAPVRQSLRRALGARCARAASELEGLVGVAMDAPPQAGVWTPRVAAALNEAVRWWHHRDVLVGGSRPGLVVLLYGPPGTGKSLAAATLAARLGMPLARVATGGVLSRWLGETEKNLARLFAWARRAGAVLFFDEADALLATRSRQVSGAADRQANTEVAQLLQLLDAHDGAVVLATNLAQVLDEAVRRRVHFSVRIDLPDGEARRRLWRGHLPEHWLRAPELRKAVDEVARRFEMSGGDIRQAAWRATVRAAARGQMLPEDLMVEAAERLRAAGRFRPALARAAKRDNVGA